jgi:hypothetical protein
LHHRSAEFTKIKVIFAPLKLREFEKRIVDIVPYTFFYDISRDENHTINTRPTMPSTRKKS